MRLVALQVLITPCQPALWEKVLSLRSKRKPFLKSHLEIFDNFLLTMISKLSEWHVSAIYFKEFSEGDALRLPQRLAAIPLSKLPFSLL